MQFTQAGSSSIWGPGYSHGRKHQYDILLLDMYSNVQGDFASTKKSLREFVEKVVAEPHAAELDSATNLPPLQTSLPLYSNGLLNKTKW